MGSDKKYRTDAQLASDLTYQKRCLNNAKLRIEAIENEQRRRLNDVVHPHHDEEGKQP